MKKNTLRLVTSAVLCALICVVTLTVKIPLPFKGYLNPGDAFILLTAWLISPWYSFFAAAVGSALADLISGYAVYAPATFFIKGLMALTAFFVFSFLSKSKDSKLIRVISALLAEAVMVLGYFVYEGILYGFGPSTVNIPMNAIQGAACTVIGLILFNIFKKIKIKM